MKKVIVAALTFAPVLALAQIPTGGDPNLTTLQSFVTAVGRLVNLALPIVVGLALLGFFWGLVKYIFAAGDGEKIDEGKSLMIWSVVALFVMVSVWGLVGFIGRTFGIGQGGSAPVPKVQGL